MQEFINFINQLGSPYSDVTWVTLLFALTAVFSYIIVFLTEQKGAVSEPQDTGPELPSEEITEQPEGQFRAPSQHEQTETEAGTVPEPVAETALRTEGEEIPFGQQQKEKQEVPEAFRPPSQVSSAPAEQHQTGQEVEPVTPQEIAEPETAEEEPAQDFFTRLRKGLSRTHAGIFGKLDNVFSRGQIDMDMWDDFEESLITADLGVATTMKLRENLESEYSGKSLEDPSGIKDALKGEIRKILKSVESESINLEHKPTIIMVAGANGVGKTTTIGKLANKFVNDGKKVTIAAGDTFRAAAVEQLEIWANRVGASFIKATKGADPSSVAFDAVQSSVSKGTDVLIIDTAGRLHTKSNLMEELSKIKRVVGKNVEGAPHEVLLVLDATTGQNAIQQAKTFKEAIDVSGIILTKLDGTSRGGVIVAVADELQIPVKFIGIGEALDDLREFNADEFVEALFISEGETVH